MGKLRHRSGDNYHFENSSQKVHSAFVSRCFRMLLFVSLRCAREQLSQKPSFLWCFLSRVEKFYRFFSIFTGLNAGKTCLIWPNYHRRMAQKTSIYAGFLFFWCPGPDLNRYELFTQRILRGLWVRFKTFHYVAQCIIRVKIGICQVSLRSTTFLPWAKTVEKRVEKPFSIPGMEDSR